MNKNIKIAVAAVAGIIILSGAAVAAWYLTTETNPEVQNQVQQTNNQTPPQNNLTEVPQTVSKTFSDEKSMEAASGTVSVYFPNTKKDPEMLDCSKVYAVERMVVFIDDKSVVAMHELLKGPTEAEKSQGYISSLPTEVNDPEITIGKGVVIADFDMTLEKGMGGSCRTATVRSQLEHTLNAVYPDDQIILSVDGRTEDILQP